MSKNTKQIVILDKIKSEYIEQAIFILKEELPGSQSVDPVGEAEKIVEEYLKNITYGLTGKMKKPLRVRAMRWVCYGSVALFLVMAAAMYYYGM